MCAPSSQPKGLSGGVQLYGPRLGAPTRSKEASQEYPPTLGPDPNSPHSPRLYVGNELLFGDKVWGFYPEGFPVNSDSYMS